MASITESGAHPSLRSGEDAARLSDILLEARKAIAVVSLRIAQAELERARVEIAQSENAVRARLAALRVSDPALERALVEIEESVASVDRSFAELALAASGSADERVLAPFDEIVGEALRHWENANPAPCVEIVARLDPTHDVRVDRAKIHRVVWHLVETALDATVADGRIVVETVDDPMGARLVVRSETPRGFAALLAHDARGLASGDVRRIVEEHRGSLHGEISPDGGAAITVWLPE